MFRSWRKQLGFLITLAMLFTSLVPAAQAASAPNIITYQGRVLNANGVPVSDSSLSMIFELYTASSGGSCVWSNSSASCATATARSVSLTTGLFTENLGDTSLGTPYAAIGDSIFGDNATLYLQVTIGGEPLSPRRLITAAPYALNADTLDGIDSATLQLFETGSSRTFEDDAATIIGANAAFTYGSGGVGDLRVEDELEVMGDGYIDNDLVVGASTSSTETITNASFTLGGNDLFVAGDVGVEGTMYIDGGLDVVGTATVGDLSCADCLSVSEIADVYVLNTGDVITGDLTLSSSTTDSPKLTFSPASGTSWELYTEDTADDLQIIVNTASTETLDIINGGAGVVNVTIDGDLTISGDDLAFTTNTSGALLIADGTDFSPTALSGDATLASTGALTIAANAVALSTDTTGNYVASASTSVLTGLTGGSSGSEGAALSLALDYSQTLSGDVGLSANAGVFGTSGFVFEGSTADTIETYISVTDPSATDKTITLPNVTGTVIVSSHTFTGDVTATLGASNTTALTVAADSVALTTDTTGNYVQSIADAGNSTVTVVNGSAEGGAVTLNVIDVNCTNCLSATEISDLTLGTDTTGNYLATLADAGGSDFTIAGSGSENAAVTIDIAADAIDFDEMVDAMSLDAALTFTGTAAETITFTRTLTDATAENALLLNVTAQDTTSGTAAQYGLLINNAASTEGLDGALVLQNSDDDDAIVSGIILTPNVGGGIGADFTYGINFDAADIGTAEIVLENAEQIHNQTNGTITLEDGGGTDYATFTSSLVTVTGDLTISGDDLFMGTNTSGFILVADGTNFNPVDVQGDVEIDSGGATTIQANAVALSTDTTGNYVATLADAGGSDFTVSGSGSEGAAVTIDIAADAIDWDEIIDSMTLDASTVVAMDSNETFTFSNGGTGNVIVNLTSSGDFVIQDNGSAFATFSDSGTISIAGATTFSTDVDMTFSGTENLIITNASATSEVIDMTVTSAENSGFELNFTLGNDTDNDTLSAMNIAVTSASTGDTDGLRGLAVTLANAQAGVNEDGIMLSGWDVDLLFGDTTALLEVADTGTFTFRESGGGNTLMTLTDNSNVGDLTTTGDITIEGDNLDSAGAPLVINATAADEVRI
ncbi:hypothetical protein HY630_01115, partial [Candidatus Uhrbacteria bacterium]|nr:hypothetical protein [Candidatus Uhrbacteria bacterium]